VNKQNSLFLRQRRRLFFFDGVEKIAGNINKTFDSFASHPNRLRLEASQTSTSRRALSSFYYLIRPQIKRNTRKLIIQQFVSLVAENSQFSAIFRRYTAARRIFSRRE
jgi:hypothetical protein